MPSNHEAFWKHDAYAVVGNEKKQTFPLLTYRGLKKLGKTVYAIDPSVDKIDGDPAYDDLAGLPSAVRGVVLETPRDDTKDWVEQVADAGIEDVWIHMQRETPEALALAKERGLNARTGTCAVMYVTPGFTYHAIHRFLRRLSGNY